MDNQILPMEIPPKSKITPEKIIIIIFSFVILVELIWAGYTFLFNKKIPLLTNNKKIEVTKKVTSINISPETTQVKKGDKFTIIVNIDSDVYSDGSDISLIYDPKMISIANEKKPVQTGSIYNNYPQNKVNIKTGVIAVSGTTDKKGGVLTNGIFGTIDFIAKTSGSTKIEIDFTPGSTTDSNIINSITTADSLEKVTSAEVNILP